METRPVAAPDPIPLAEREALAPPVETAPEVATTGSVQLRVAWHDGEPAADVAATARVSGSEEGYDEGLDVRTGADGTCLLAGLRPGLASFEIDRSEESWRTQVVPGKEVELLVTLPRGYDVVGEVTFENVPVSGAEIWLDHGIFGWGGHRVARSDAAGRYRIRSIEDGLCWIGARAPLRAPSPKATVMGGTGATVEVALELTQAGGALEGRVLDLEGRPFGEAHVLVGDERDPRRIGAAHAPGAQRTRCDASGTFRFEGVEPGLWPLRARAPGCARWNGEIEILAGSTTSLAITLLPGSTVRGIVTDPGGRPVSGAEVRCGRGLFGDRSQVTGAGGTFVLHDLPVGEFELVVEAEAQGRASATLFGVAGSEIVWNPVVEGMILRGRLVLNGLDPAQCWVRCESEDIQDPYLADDRPDAAGAFEFTGLAGATYRIQVSGAGEFFFPVAVLAGVRPGAEELVLELDPARWPSIRLKGRVLDARRQPLAGIRLSPVAKKASSIPILTTAADGTFDIGPYPPGPWGVSVGASGPTRLRTEFVEVAPQQTWDFGDLILE